MIKCYIVLRDHRDYDVINQNAFMVNSEISYCSSTWPNYGWPNCTYLIESGCLWYSVDHSMAICGFLVHPIL